MHFSLEGDVEYHVIYLALFRGRSTSDIDRRQPFILIYLFLLFFLLLARRVNAYAVYGRFCVCVCVCV